jgi:hypothetical protein
MAFKKLSQSHPHDKSHGQSGNGAREAPLQKIAGSSAVNNPDFKLENHGSLFLLRPLNSAAKGWMNEHLPMDNPETQFWGDAIVIDSRYVAPIVTELFATGWSSDEQTHSNEGNTAPDHGGVVSCGAELDGRREGLCACTSE